MNYALITGGSTGLGLELAKLFAQNGINLLLIARNELYLKSATKQLEEDYKVEVITFVKDLSKSHQIEEIVEHINQHSIFIEFLVNNAAFYVKGAFTDTFWQDEEELIQLQCLNHIKLTKLLLPKMLKQGTGKILNISSNGALVPGPYNAVYCSTKSFLQSFSLALSEELKDTKVSASTLCPSGMNTGFQDLRERKTSILFPLSSAKEVAQIGFKGMMKGKRLIIPGILNKIEYALLPFIPLNLKLRMAASFTKSKIEREKS